MFLFLPLLSFKSLLSKKDSSGFSVYTSKIVHRTSEGKWIFQLFGKNIIKTTFQPNGYTRNEQPSNAVILKPYTGKKTILNAEEQAIEFGNVARVLLKGQKHSYDFGGEVKDVLAEYFSEYDYKGFRFKLHEDEHIFGGGERALPMSRRGFGFGLNNSAAFSYSEGQHDLNFSVPFIISSKGYGVFFDNASKGYLDIGRKDSTVLEAGFSSGELTFYIINGKNPDEILRHYTDLVGRQSIPGRWVFGNLMSRYGYRSEAQLMGTVAKMKEEKFPVDGVILDLFWFGDSIRNTMGNLDWVDDEKWPEPEKMIADLKDQGIKTVLITEPYVVMGSKNYGESKKYHSLDYNGEPYTLTDFYFGFGGLLDMFRKDAQDWFWSKYKKQIDKGIAGWWGDLGEPETHPGDTFIT
jgi:oligosaccharide 4-alpha-D-glucosyltransferase